MEKFDFDKFMQDIVIREDASREIVRRHQEGQDEHPMRRLNRLYTEKWSNRIVWRRSEQG
jgi:hypothetical protein